GSARSTRCNKPQRHGDTGPDFTVSHVPQIIGRLDTSQHLSSREHHFYLHRCSTQCEKLFCIQNRKALPHALEPPVFPLSRSSQGRQAIWVRGDESGGQ